MATQRVGEPESIKLKGCQIFCAPSSFSYSFCNQDVNRNAHFLARVAAGFDFDLCTKNFPFLPYESEKKKKKKNN